jgi:hypothetical protein
VFSPVPTAVPFEGRLDTCGALPRLGGVAGELLAERDRHCVHPVRAAGLDDVVELLRLPLERVAEPDERGQQVVDELVERGEVDGRREDVVRRLAHVHVVVRMDILAGEVRHDLVRVHVRRGAGARLEDVDREVVVELAGGDPVTRGGDALGLVGVEQAELGVHTRSGCLDPAEPAGDRNRDGLTGDRKVGDRFLRLSAPKRFPFLGPGHMARV